MGLGVQEVEDPNLVAGRDEGVDHVRSDEPGASGDQDAGHAGPDRGSWTVKQAPPFSLRTVTSPRCASTRPRAMASPSPAPSRGVRAGSPRNATSKTWGRSASGMPPPVSFTDT